MHRKHVVLLIGILVVVFGLGIVAAISEFKPPTDEKVARPAPSPTQFGVVSLVDSFAYPDPDRGEPLVSAPDTIPAAYSPPEISPAQPGMVVAGVAVHYPDPDSGETFLSTPGGSLPTYLPPALSPLGPGAVGKAESAGYTDPDRGKE